MKVYEHSNTYVSFKGENSVTTDYISSNGSLLTVVWNIFHAFDTVIGKFVYNQITPKFTKENLIKATKILALGNTNEFLNESS